MVLFAMIARLHDGLPLSATTDHDPSQAVLLSKKYAKILSKKAQSFPDRCSLFTGSHWLYLISSLGVCFITLCEESYPAVLAYCFLDEVQREFISLYDGKRVDSCRRPYALIEFDQTIAKTKQRYLSTRTLRTRTSLTDMSQEVKLRPPHRLNLDDLGPVPGSVTQDMNSSGYTYRPQTNSKQVEMSWITKLTLVLCAMCSVMNFFRVIGLLNAGAMNLDNESSSLFRGATMFFLAFALATFQSYLLIYNSSWREFKCLMATFLTLFANFYLYIHGLRFGFTVAFHAVVFLLAAFQIMQKPDRLKLPDYTV
ncbi:vesicle-trafficking protein SEC22a-like isoform X2 [Amphiura filiformis]